MDSDRCYRKKLPLAEIIKELERCAGTQFDDEILKHMYQMIEDGFKADENT